MICPKQAFELMTNGGVLTWVRPDGLALLTAAEVATVRRYTA